MELDDLMDKASEALKHVSDEQIDQAADFLDDKIDDKFDIVVDKVSDVAKNLNDK